LAEAQPLKQLLSPQIDKHSFVVSDLHSCIRITVLVSVEKKSCYINFVFEENL